MAYTIILQLYIFGKIGREWLTYDNYLNSFLEFTSVFLLFAAVLRLHFVVKRLNYRAIFEKERQMLIFTVFTGLYCLSNLAYTVSSNFYDKTTELESDCRSFIYFEVLGYVFVFVKCMNIVLYTFMSVQFSKPLSGEWQ